MLYADLPRVPFSLTGISPAAISPEAEAPGPGVSLTINTDMRSLFLCLFLLLCSSCVLSQVTLVESGPGAVKPSDPVRLGCKVTGVSVTADRYCWCWMRQCPWRGLEWLGRICSGSGTSYPPSLKHRLSITRDASKNEFYLQITEVTFEDTAMYYCARCEYALVFGAGTKLTVEPRDQAVSQPSVFVLRSEGTEDDKSACLAKDFFPKEVAIFMNTSSTNTGLQKAVSILSNSGKYSAVHVSNFSHAEDVHCTVRHQAADITDKEVSRKPKDGPKATPKQAQECEPTQSSPIVHSKEKVNTLSLTVMGLRVLFAKSLAFNFLLSVRFFMF